MRGRAFLIVALAIMVSAIAQSPRPASAVPTGIFTIDMYPPVGSDTGAAEVNCGWHSGCSSPYPDGTGVDWDDEDGSGTCCSTGRLTVWRSWTWITNISFKAYIANVRIHRITSASCFRTEMYVQKGGDAAHRAGAIRQDHADYSSTDGYFWLHAASIGFYTGVLAGTIVLQEKTGCPWTAPHVHEGHIDNENTWTRHVGLPPGMIRGADDCSPPGGGPCGTYIYDDPALEPTVHSRHIAYNVTI